MSSGYSGRVWACPFFKWDGPRRVRCEGGGVTLCDEAMFKRYAEGFCANVDGWEKCCMARELVRRYEKGESGHGENG